MIGEDAGAWRPERWLDCDGGQRRRMEASLLTVRLVLFPSLIRRRMPRHKTQPPHHLTPSAPPLTPPTVRSRPPQLHRQKHLQSRNLQTDPVLARYLCRNPLPPPPILFPFLHPSHPTTKNPPQITFAHPACPEWKVENRWFVNQTGLVVRLQPRR